MNEKKCRGVCMCSLCHILHALHLLQCIVFSEKSSKKSVAKASSPDVTPDLPRPERKDSGGLAVAVAKVTRAVQLSFSRTCQGPLQLQEIHRRCLGWC